jgi:hypothetical protein
MSVVRVFGTISSLNLRESLAHLVGSVMQAPCFECPSKSSVFVVLTRRLAFGSVRRAYQLSLPAYLSSLIYYEFLRISLHSSSATSPVLKFTRLLNIERRSSSMSCVFCDGISALVLSINWNNSSWISST